MDRSGLIEGHCCCEGECTTYCEIHKTRYIPSLGVRYTVEEVEPGLFRYLHLAPKEGR